MKHKTGVRTVILLLVGVHAVLLFAGFFSPYDAKEQDRNLPYAPPTRFHFTGRTGFHLRPFVYVSVPDVDGYREDPAEEYPLQFIVRGNPYSLLGAIGFNVHLFGVQSPARIMLLGADAFGRDEFSRLLFGGQISLAAGLLATLLTLATVAGVVTASGFYWGGSYG